MARSKGVNEKAGLKRDLATVYTPSAPIVDPSLFSGREELLAQLSDRLGEAGTHFVLYGERSVGKTSLRQVLLANRRFRRHSASASDDFLSIFLPVLEALGEQFSPEERQSMVAAGFSAGWPNVVGAKLEESAGSTDTAVAKRQVDLNLVLERVGRHADKIDAIVIDEFHNITSPLVQAQLIELAKGLSDQRIDVQLFLVIVADSDDDLISSHEYQESKTRHFSISRIPRMSDDEIRDIVKKAGVHVEQDDLRAAVERFVAVFDADHRAAAIGYREVCGAPSRRAFEEVLDALASSPSARMDTAVLAKQLTMVPSKLETLVGAGFDLVEKAGTTYELTVRELRPYLKARQYLEATGRPMQLGTSFPSFSAG